MSIYPTSLAHFMMPECGTEEKGLPNRMISPKGTEDSFMFLLRVCHYFKC